MFQRKEVRQAKREGKEKRAARRKGGNDTGERMNRRPGGRRWVELVKQQCGFQPRRSATVFVPVLAVFMARNSRVSHPITVPPWALA